MKQLEAGHISPKEAVITTGLFFLLGTIPTVIPFFTYAFVEHPNILNSTLIASFLAIIVIATAGVITEVLSNKRPIKKF